MPEDVLNLAKEAIKKDREVQDKVAELPSSECNFDTVSTTSTHAVTALRSLLTSLRFL
jgi:hypothetical protein